MNLQYKDSPFPHIIVTDYFTNTELSDIWKEIEFLTNDRKLLPPEQTGSGFIKETGELLKKNFGIFLDTAYTHRSMSNILHHTRKSFNQEMMKFAMDNNEIFAYLETCNKDTVLLSYYEEGGFYRSHKDKCALTILTHLYREPKVFTGGNLLFEKHDYKIDIENNKTIIIPSYIPHTVTEIEMKTGSSLSGLGRYCISHFISHL